VYLGRSQHHILDIRHDHRTILGGILRVVRTCASWRDLLLEIEKRETACKRYRLWQANGLWQRLLTVPDDDAQTATDKMPAVQSVVGVQRSWRS
jgi:transposase